MNDKTMPAAGPADELSGLLASLVLADPQVHAHLTVIPLLAKAGSDAGPVYLPLSEALESSRLVITEISAHGSVPELQAENTGDFPVLLVDGEEVSGAKQNRVLNTSVLLKEHSRTVIPVSCTESGRWRYETAHFADSGLVMAHKARANKMTSVHHSLNTGHQYLSDQAKVWSDVAALHGKTKTTSATHAMAAAFANHHVDLERCRETFKLVPGQHGLLVLFGGRVAGFDYVSRPEAYARLHDKLLKSYAIEVLVSGGGESPAPGVALDRAREFLSRTASSACERYPSIGYGQSLRFRTRGLAGAALVHERRVIHLTALNPHADAPANHYLSPL